MKNLGKIIDAHVTEKHDDYVVILICFVGEKSTEIGMPYQAAYRLYTDGHTEQEEM